ncbi:hypothetical protein L227DRAFT_472100, partial [Lentinus tigrinus ALCF2SS1-6]
RVVLHGPRGERREGVSPTDASVQHKLSDNVLLPGEYKPVEPPAEQESQFLEYLSENSEGLDLLTALKDRYGEDPFFALILEAPKQYKNFVVEGGLVFIRDARKRLLCVPKILVSGRSAREIVIRHAHSLLAHLGAHRTLCLLRDHLWWKT